MTTGLRWSEDQLAAHMRRHQDHARTLPLTRVGLTLPFPPSVNHSLRDGVACGRKTDRYRAFVADVAKVVDDAGNPRLEGRLGMEIIAQMPDRRKRDLDNLIKSTQDALAKAGVYDDDCQIDDLYISRTQMVWERGALLVTIRTLA